MDIDGTTIAFSSYAISAVISMLTAAAMWVAVKAIMHGNRRREGKK